MSGRKSVSISEDSMKATAKYAEKLGIMVGEAADKLIATAVSRINALSRYSKNQKAAEKPKAKPKKRVAIEKKVAKTKKKVGKVSQLKKRKKVAKAAPQEADHSQVNGVAEEAST